jgi:hypothetical protein
MRALRVAGTTIVFAGIMASGVPAYAQQQQDRAARRKPFRNKSIS